MKFKRAPRQIAHKLMPEVDVQLLLRATRKGRKRILLQALYYEALRV